MLVVFLFGAVVFHTAACARAKTVPASGVEKPAKSERTLDAKALIKERCVQCHGTFRITAARFLPIPAAPLVDRMIKHGAKLNDQERAAVIEYLAW
ncbi:MAG: hypothetical protein N3D11_17555 [Candidatus Sumerlaeia bacterium]|nr:hypothetical protein [Candidatus Sumerlaeia bacterium]